MSLRDLPDHPYASSARNGSDLVHDRAPREQRKAETETERGNGAELGEMMDHLAEVEWQIDKTGAEIKREMRSLGEKTKTPQAKRVQVKTSPVSAGGDRGRRLEFAARQRRGASPS